jgi:hypothetical protein
MRKRFTLRVVLTLWCFSSVALAGSGGSNPVLTGTVNIVLANANGIVVLTDSNQTVTLRSGEQFISRLPGQKLFRLDERTVCTIAGFGSAFLPGFPEFSSSAAGVLDSYVEELRSRGGTHSFREKLTTLKFLFIKQLSGIGNLQHLDEAQLGYYEFELILAGYDLDGTARLGKIVLSTSLLPNGIFSPVLKQLTEKTVGREFIYEKAGIGGSAVENILTYPAQLADEPEIGRYAASKASDRGGSLTVSEMEALAKSLARHAAMVNRRYVSGFRRTLWPVGGRDQIAILEKGSIQKIDQPTLSFEQRRVNMTPFGIITGITIDTNGTGAVTSYVPPGIVGLFLKMGFIGDVLLDNGYYYEDDFRNGTLHYDGGLLGFDPSNRVTDCVLSLGPHADRHSADVQELIARFHWKAVQYLP